VLTNLLTTWRENKTLQRDFIWFVSVASLFYGAWYFGYETYLATKTDFDTVLCRFIAEQAAVVMNLFGYQTAIVSLGWYPNIMVVNGSPVVSVGPSCNGFALTVLFTAFILAYPGPAKRKLWYIPLGLLVLHIVNVFRCIALAFVMLYARSSFDFNHKYAFVVIVYSIFSLLWLWWVLYLSQPAISISEGFSNMIRFRFVKLLLNPETEPARSELSNPSAHQSATPAQ
jgi:exosortase family protein XrtF